MLAKDNERNLEGCQGSLATYNDWMTPTSESIKKGDSSDVLDEVGESLPPIFTSLSNCTNAPALKVKGSLDLAQVRGGPIQRLGGTINTMVRVEEDTSITASSARRHSPGDNTTLVEFQRRQERKKAGKSHDGGPEKESAKERLVLGSSRPDPKKQDKANHPPEKENVSSLRNTPATKKRLEDQKLAKIAAELKKLRNDSDQQ
ncbi:OLC1v1030461C1 [Oldenlandia corymbosa var. corymbosa]|uniref:OLC1v1030461C1 n=1 Tax=Oldenlandia corymbosa var. corymbosa TaxID=529605 RepID=A0AAV1CHQ1_OLDCO|nr:OLC1v1030461C1 [Oldenlandia corymbosa var. corymbosa]